MEDNNLKELIDVINTQFDKFNITESTLISVHGIETKITANDELIERNDMLYILKENGEREIITFKDHIFKIIMK